MYNLKDLSLISGLTERTLRNYLKMGVLVGEKKNGVWSFTEKQIDDFLVNDYVKASMDANRRSVIYDYLRSEQKDVNTACIILNLPEDNPQKISRFFCDAVNKRNGLRMTYDRRKGLHRVVLVGMEESIYDILSDYHSMKF